jgi:hypothetical protein
MSEQAPSSGGKMDLRQGDPGLLESDLARRLLVSTVPARFAFVWTDGTPRVLPTWFHWTGTELVMPTFLSAPHVRKAAARVEALRANPAVAITIDTEGFPPEVLLLRGRASVAEVDQPGTRMARIAVRPTWVGVIDFKTRLPAGMGGVTRNP